MWNRRLCFLLLLGEGVYLGMLYNYQGIRLMLCFLIFLPLVCLLLLLLSWPACRVVLRTGQDVITRGEQVEVRVAVENRGLFPVSRVLVCVRWKAPGQKEVRMKRWICGLGRGCRGEAVFALSPQHCGQARFRVSRVRVYDYLALFCLPGKVFLEGRFFERRCVLRPEWTLSPGRRRSCFLRFTGGRRTEIWYCGITGLGTVSGGYTGNCRKNWTGFR